MKMGTAFSSSIVAVGVVVLSGAALAETSTADFLSRSEITLPARSRLFDAVDLVDGCGAAPAGGRITVDGEAGDWLGEPTWIAGAGRYDRGEYVWTDYPFDDDGTGSFQYPGEGEGATAAPGTIGKATPRNQRYGANAADVVELRVAADEAFLYFLVRLNFLNAVDSTVVALGFDLDDDAATGVSEWPRGAGLESPGVDLFLTAYGKCAVLTTAAAEQSLDAAGGSIRVGTRENVFEVAVPRDRFGAAAAIRMVGGAGLWDAAAGRWLGVQAQPAVRQNASDQPRGARSAGDPAIFNLLFRGDEITTDGCGGASDSRIDCALASPRTFQTARQHAVLATGTTGPYAVAIDIARVTPGGTGDPQLLRRGVEKHFTRVYRSRIDAEGVQVNGSFAVFLGRYQPYSVYVPGCFEDGCPGLWPEGRAPLAILLHGGSGSHVSNPPRPSIPEGGTDLYGLETVYSGLEAKVAPVVVSALGRGQRPPWWRGLGEADVLEGLDDARRRYGTDPERQFVGGGSLGGYGTLRLGSLYADVWNGAFAHCPAEFEDSISARDVGNVDPSTQPFVIDPVLPALVDVPLRQASGTVDPLVPIVADHRLRDGAFAAELDFQYTEYLAGSHCFDLAETLYPWVANHNEETAALLRAKRASTPAVVRYRIDPRHYPASTPLASEPLGVFDIRDAGISYRGVYWVSGLEVRPEVEALATSGQAPGGADTGTVAAIDAASHMRSGSEITTRSCGESVGAGWGTGGNPRLEPRNATPNAYRCQEQVRSDDVRAALDLSTRNLAAAAVDLAGAGIDVSGAFSVSARGDGALRLTLEGVAASSVTGACVTGHSSGSATTAIDLVLGPEPCTIGVAP